MLPKTPGVQLAIALLLLGLSVLGCYKELFPSPRILIVDWDVHHGNGTQHMFEDDPR